MGFTAGTLAEYDAVLSVSEEAVNRGLQDLWNTEIVLPKDEHGNQVQPPITEIEDHSPPPRAKYLINHDISIHSLIDDTDENGNPIKSRAVSGIDGHILAPKVTFSEDQRYARMHLTFFKDQTVLSDSSLPKETTAADRERLSKSLLVAFDVNTGKKVYKDLDGYTCSWKCKLDTKDIKNIMEDLIKPAEDAANPTTASKGLVDKLKDLVSKKNSDGTVPAEDFLVSSMFCLFETHDAMQDFKITDKDGKDISGVTYTTLMGSLVDYFNSMKTTPGIPNPNSPFVLGYGISQKLPGLSTTYPGVHRENTPKYFIPKTFHLTATKGTTTATKGTLNYCMITHRNLDSSGKEESRAGIDPTTDKNAGNITPDLFSLTKMSSKNSDAVMAFSSNMFFKKFVLDTLFAAVHLDLTQAFQFWVNFAKDRAEDQGEVRYSNDGSPECVYGDWAKSGEDRDVRITRKQHCQTPNGFDSTELKIPTFSFARVKTHQEGSSTTNMVIESSLSQNTSGDVTLPDDFKRKIRITCTNTAQLKFFIETHSRGNIVGPANQWSEAYTTEIKSSTKLVIDFEASVAGTWNVSINNELSHFPRSREDFVNNMSDYSTQSLVNGVLNSRQPRILENAYASIDHGFHGAFKYLDFLLGAIESQDPMSKFQQSIFTESIGNSVDKLDSILNGFDHTVIMPGGEAFKFTGLDTDTQGAVYSHLTYLAGTSGAEQKIVKGPA